VAIKKIDLQGLMMEDILTEIRVLRMNTSPQIVNYLDSYLIHEELWLVMEFMDGGTLYEAVEAFEMTEDEMGIVSREDIPFQNIGQVEEDAARKRKMSQDSQA
ncbi:hypothetical protein HGM15179_022051, partial [Zosterops borbonicus]